MKRRFLILHGWSGSGPSHWQAWLAEELISAGHDVRFPKLANSYHPKLHRWLELLKNELEAISDPENLTVVCHSLGVILWLHFAHQNSQRVADRVILVAPPGPSACVKDIATFFPVERDGEALRRAASRTELVCTNADPYCPELAARFYGEYLQIPTTILPDEAGHINVASGYGPWPWMKESCLNEGPVS